MRKKLLVVGIIAVLALVMAVGCGNEKAEQPQQEPVQVEEQAQPEAAVNEDGLIGEEKAKALALERVEGAQESDIWDFDLDKDDGRMEYEGEIRYNGMEYEFEINAESGEFIKWEQEKEYD